jgi:hypothetical protein
LRYDRDEVLNEERPSHLGPRAGAGRGHDRLQPTLEIRTAGGRQLYWEFEHPGGVTTRATGTGSTTGQQVSLSGRQTTGTGYSTHMTYTFELTRERR